MTEGILRVKKSKKEKISARIEFTNKKGKTAFISVQNIILKDTALDGQSIEFESEKGIPTRILHQGKEIFKKEIKPPSPSKTQYPVSTGQQNYHPPEPSAGEPDIHHIDADITNPAKAPYNFIPLNEKVVTINSIPDFDRYEKDRYTGYIDLYITTKTPLYIRDTMTKAEMKKQNKEDRYINPDFYGPGNKLKIPGSSIRGMIRTMVEITGFGRFGPFDDKYLYYRGLADKTTLREEYQKWMCSRDNQKKRTNYKISAGILFKRGFDYFIKPAAGFKQIFKDEAREKVEQTGERYNDFSFYKVGNDWIVVSGPMPKKKRDWLIMPDKNSKEIKIPREDVKSYRNDSRGERVPDLLNEAGKKSEVPCFYVNWTDTSGKKRISFGHTGMFRLAYQKSIGDHIPENLKTMTYDISPDSIERMKKSGVPGNIIRKLEGLERKIFKEKEFTDILKKFPDRDQAWIPIILKHAGQYDFATAVFGNTEAFAGRVFFEDAILEDGQKNVLMNTSIPRLLQSPKPTTFQHYLVQKSAHTRYRDHYNSNTAIRGYKMYWHKSGINWVEKDRKNLERKKLITRIQPVKPNTRFFGRIRFENLSKEETGALLFAMNLPQGCYHKLGMGKPLGLGAVRLKPVLHLSNREKRYSNLFFEWKNSPEEQNADIAADFQKAFETCVIKATGEKTDSLWETARLKELATMLNFEKGCKKEAGGNDSPIRYMRIEGPRNNEYKDRPVLPLPRRMG